MKSVHILIVEDDLNLLAFLKASYRKIFSDLGYKPTFEQASTVADARRLAKTARGKPYDFVSLDVNLGERTLNGLHVLETLNCFQSAWMVALLTGVESDESLDKTVGSIEAEDLRKTLRQRAYASFPAERLMVVEKPDSLLKDADKAEKAQARLTNRLVQIAHVYEEIERLRYVFRPITVPCLKRVPSPKGSKEKGRIIETTSVHWQIRFNCGDMRTLPDMVGFQTLRLLLSQDRNQVVTPEEALMKEPKNEKPENVSPDANEEPVAANSVARGVAAYFKAKGIVCDGLPPDTLDALIQEELSPKMMRYMELREMQDDKNPKAYFLASEENELEAMVKGFGPLAAIAEDKYRSRAAAAGKQNDTEQEAPGRDAKNRRPGGATVAAVEGLGQEGGIDVTNGPARRGKESKAGWAFRQRKGRVFKYLRENGYAEFAKHIEDSIQSPGAKWSYNPPDDIEWTT